MSSLTLNMKNITPEEKQKFIGSFQRLNHSEQLVCVDDSEYAKTLDRVYAIANNAIYFSDSSDYLSALYDVCNAIKPDEDEWDTRHGKEFIDSDQPTDYTTPLQPEK